MVIWLLPTNRRGKGCRVLSLYSLSCGRVSNYISLSKWSGGSKWNAFNYFHDLLHYVKDVSICNSPFKWKGSRIRLKLMRSVFWVECAAYRKSDTCTMQRPRMLSPFSLSLSNSVTFPQPLICYPAFHFLLSPFYLRSSCLWPQLPPATAAAGWIGGLDPSLHTRVCVAQLYCECPTHTEFRYIEAHSSRCQWCFCGKLAMSPLYSGFPLINQPSGKPSLSASTSLIHSLPRKGGGGMWEGVAERKGNRDYWVCT